MEQVVDFSRREVSGFDPAQTAGLELTSQSPETNLREAGWSRFRLVDLPFPRWLAAGFEGFALRMAEDLPPDPYDPTQLRKRRYGVFVWIPSTGLLFPASREFDDDGMPVTPYLQGDEYQSEFGNEVRWFSGLEEWTMSSPILAALIEADGMVARESGVLPDASTYFVGVHAIGLVPAPGRAAVITPNEIHCDGEPVTFVHLLKRANVSGGWNAVADRAAIGGHPDAVDEALLHARFSLDIAGDGFVVDDRRVAHFVEGVSLRDASLPGERTVLLVDFCPARRVLSHELR